MQQERDGHTLQTTALVHEAYLRLAGVRLDYHHRVHFFAMAAQMMRRVLVDYARSRGYQKRGAGAAVGHQNWISDKEPRAWGGCRDH